MTTEKKTQKVQVAPLPSIINVEPHEKDEEWNDTGYFRILNTKLDISNLTDIDTTKRTFRCAVEVTMRWRMTTEEENEIHKLCRKMRNNIDQTELNKYLKENIECPKIYCENERELLFTHKTSPNDVEISLINDADGRGQFCSIQQFRGIWTMQPDQNELDDFPFDHVSLPIFLKLVNTRDRFRIDIDEENLKNQKSKKGIVIRQNKSHEFKSYMVHIMSEVRCDPTRETYYGGLSIYIQCQRRWWYYFKQVIIFVLVLSLMIFPVYAIPASDISARLGRLLTTMAAQTIFLYVVHSSIPKLKYWNIFEQYIVFNYIFALFVCIQMGLMVLYDPGVSIDTIKDEGTDADKYKNAVNDAKHTIKQCKEHQERVDNIFLVVFAVIFLLSNLFFVIKSKVRVNRLTQMKFNIIRLTELGYPIDKDAFINSKIEIENYDDKGICVYHKHNRNKKNFGEYRYWKEVWNLDESRRKRKSKPFDLYKFTITDYTVMLFRPQDLEKFRSQNERDYEPCCRCCAYL
eukprot:443499_1